MDESKLTAMYTSSCEMVELAVDLAESQQFAEFGPVFSTKYLQLGAFIVLKIGRSHIRELVDLPRGRRAYFSVIQLQKKMSVRLDDIFARASIICTQIWTSNNIFRRSDGTIDSLFLRCRSRLGMSVVFDCYWWWRQEFNGQPNPYEEAEG